MKLSFILGLLLTVTVLGYEFKVRDLKSDLALAKKDIAASNLVVDWQNFSVEQWAVTGTTAVEAQLANKALADKYVAVFNAVTKKEFDRLSEEFSRLSAANQDATCAGVGSIIDSSFQL